MKILAILALIAAAGGTAHAQQQSWLPHHAPSAASGQSADIGRGGGIVDPWALARSLHDEVSRLASSLPALLDWAGDAGVRELETDAERVLVVDMPGFAARELTVTTTDTELRVDAMHKCTDRDGAYCVAREQHHTWPLKSDTNVHTISANLDHGVLRIHLPKRSATRGFTIPVVDKLFHLNDPSTDKAEKVRVREERGARPQESDREVGKRHHPIPPGPEEWMFEDVEYAQFRDIAGGAADQVRDTVKSAADMAQQAAGGAAGVIRDTAGGAAERVYDAARDAAAHVRDTAGDAAARVRDTAGDAAERVRNTAGDAAARVRDKAMDAKDKAKDTAYSAYDKARNAAGEAAEQAKDTAYSAYDKARNAAGGAAEQAKASVRSAADRASATAASASGKAKDMYGQAQDRAGQAADTLKSSVSSAAHHASSSAVSAKDRASASAASATDRAKATASSMGEEATETARGIMDWVAEKLAGIQEAATDAKGAAQMGYREGEEQKRREHERQRADEL